MRRATAILTVLAFTVLVPGASAGQTTEQKRVSPTPRVVATPSALIKKYDQLVQKKEKQRRKVSTCKSAERAIVYYRNRVWHHQDELHEARSPTRYPERRIRACPYKKWVAKNWQAIAREYHKQIELFNKNPKAAICYVFRDHCEEAIVVSWCESRHDIWADNGQYLGLFQMGNFARSTYGHSNTAIGQVIAAYKYFVASGKDWSPWSCKPW